MSSFFTHPHFLIKYRRLLDHFGFLIKYRRLLDHFDVNMALTCLTLHVPDTRKVKSKKCTGFLLLTQLCQHTNRQSCSHDYCLNVLKHASLLPSCIYKCARARACVCVRARARQRARAPVHMKINELRMYTLRKKMRQHTPKQMSAHTHQDTDTPTHILPSTHTHTHTHSLSLSLSLSHTQTSTNSNLTQSPVPIHMTKERLRR